MFFFSEYVNGINISGQKLKTKNEKIKEFDQKFNAEKYFFGNSE